MRRPGLGRGLRKCGMGGERYDADECGCAKCHGLLRLALTSWFWS